MNFIEAFNKLKATDIKDVKNIDLSKLSEILKQSPVYLLITATIIGTIFLAITFISKAKLDKTKFSQTVTEYEQKLEALKEQTNVKKLYDEFVNGFAKPVNDNQLVDKFSELAGSRGLQVISFSPITHESKDSYIITSSVNLSIESNDYKNIILFVKDIEDLPYAVRIERFIARQSEAGTSSNYAINKDNKNNQIRADIEVSSIKIK